LCSGSVRLSGSKRYAFVSLLVPPHRLLKYFWVTDDLCFRSVLALVGDSMDNSSTFLELKPHIVKRMSHPIRAMPNLHPLVAKNGFLIEESITQVTKKNVVVRDWSLRTQKAKWDSLKEGYISNLPEREDMTPTIEEYASLLRIDNVQLNKIYVNEPKPMTFKKKLMKLTGMTDTWAEKQIKKKNEVSCIPWFSLRELVQNHPNILKRVDLFALAIYELIVFPNVLGHIEVSVVDFFEKLRQIINPNLRAEYITWRAPWICPFVLLYKCGNQDWVPLLGLWGGVGYASLWFKDSSLQDSLYRLLMDWHNQSLPLRNTFLEEMSSELEMAKHELEHEKAKLLRDI
ncbi:hypothetical protein Gogos_020195, partial [Gossypium gossypioides]|nr:hypothetical protein [Gossypium gossypioides]